MRVIGALLLTSTPSLLVTVTPRALAEALIIVITMVGACAIPGFALAAIVGLDDDDDDRLRLPPRERLPFPITPRVPLPPRLALAFP